MVKNCDTLKGHAYMPIGSTVMLSKMMVGSGHMAQSQSMVMISTMANTTKYSYKDWQNSG